MPVGFTATPTGPSPTTGAHPAGITAAGRRAVVHGRMTSPGRILRIDQDDFHRLLASDLEIDDIVFAAFVARREIPRGGVATGSIRIVGSRHSGRALDSRYLPNFICLGLERRKERGEERGEG